MKTILRKCLSVSLAMCMLFTGIPFAAIADEVVSQDIYGVQIEKEQPSVDEPTLVSPDDQKDASVPEQTGVSAVEPIEEPIVEPIVEPTEEPTVEPIVEPTEAPIVEPSEEPIVEPTEEPTVEPSEESIVEPSEEPIVEPTEEPTVELSEEPIVEPTEEPIVEPTEESIENIIEDEIGIIEDFDVAMLMMAMSDSVCAHEETYSEEIISDGGYIIYDDYYHECGIVVKKTITYCSACKEVLDEITEYDRSNSYLDYHNFYSGREGCICGYICSHEITESKVHYFDPYNYVSINEKEHQFNYERKKVANCCVNCYKEISQEWMDATEKDVVIGNHYYFVNGSCRDCGYTKSNCNHNNVLRAGEEIKKCTIIDENYHTNTLMRNEGSYDCCMDCGTPIKDGSAITPPDDSYSSVEKSQTYPSVHTFKNGVCIECGYVKEGTVCDHSTGNYNDVLDENIAPVYSNITETTHCVQYSYKRYCEDCGEYIKSVIDESITPVEHDFTNGDTCVCGYVKETACDHSAGNYNDVKDETVAPVYNNKTETTHCVQYSYKRYCKDCGEYIKNVVDEGLKPIPHDFSNGNACVCGYVKDAVPCDEHKWVQVKAPTQPWKEHPNHYQTYKCSICGETKTTAITYSSCCKCTGNHEWLISVYSVGVNVCQNCGEKWYTNKNKEEFYTILKGMEEGEDPLDNPRIVDLMVDELVSSGFNETIAKQAINKVKADSVPDDYKTIFVYSFFDYAKKDSSSNGKNGMYQPDTNVLYSDSSAYSTANEFLLCFFHEMGHAVDFYPSRNGDKATTYTEQSDLYKCIIEDARDYLSSKVNIYAQDLTETQKQHIINAFLSGSMESTDIPYWWGDENVVESYRTTAYPPEYFTKEEKEVYCRVVELCFYHLGNLPAGGSCMVMDVLPGITNNAITSGRSHRKEYSGEYYWYDEFGRPTIMAGTEAWAEHFSAVINGDSEAYDANKLYMPETVAYMDNIASELANYYRNKVINR